MRKTMIKIDPIKTGFTVECYDNDNYNGDIYAFTTWDEVVKFIADKEPKFFVSTYAAPVTTIGA